MKSLEVLLSEALGKMSEKQKNSFFEKRVRGMAIEGQVSLAKECLAQESSAPIRRNNGASSWVDESAFSESKSEAMLYDLMEKARPDAFGGGTSTLKEVAALSPKQKFEYDFSRGIGLTESQALASAKSNIQD